MVGDNRIVCDVGVGPGWLLAAGGCLLFVPMYLEWVAAGLLHLLPVILSLRDRVVDLFLDRLLDVLLHDLGVLAQLAIQGLIPHVEVVLSVLGRRFERRRMPRVCPAQASVVLVDSIEAGLGRRREVLRVVAVVPLPSCRDSCVVRRRIRRADLLAEHAGGLAADRELVDDVRIRPLARPRLFDGVELALRIDGRPLVLHASLVRVRLVRIY